MTFIIIRFINVIYCEITPILNEHKALDTCINRKRGWSSGVVEQSLVEALHTVWIHARARLWQRKPEMGGLQHVL